MAAPASNSRSRRPPVNADRSAGASRKTVGRSSPGGIRPRAERATLDLVRRERIGNRGRLPAGGVQEEELHRTGFLPS